MSYKTNKENYILLAKIIYQYKDYMPKLAIQKMFTIDFIKNNYTKSTMINYLINTRRYIKDGFVPKSFKGFPLMLKESLDKVIKGEAANIQLQEELLQPKEESKEMEAKTIENPDKYDKKDICVALAGLEEYFNKKKTQIEIKINVLSELRQILIEEYNKQKKNLMEQYLNENFYNETI